MNTPQMHDHARCPPPHVVCLFIVLYDSTDLKDWHDRVEEGKSMTKRKKVKEEGTDREAERKTDRQIKCNGHKTPKLPESWILRIILVYHKQGQNDIAWHNRN